MPQPPLRNGLEPLIRIGLVKTPLSQIDDAFLDFLMFCETIYREHTALKVQLAKCDVDPEKFLKGLSVSPGMPGRHRLVFDGRYLQLSKRFSGPILEAGAQKIGLERKPHNFALQIALQGHLPAETKRARMLPIKND
jgi:hypothetical protein